MGSEAPERGSFAGHETFPFRFGWLPKAVAATHQDPEVFGHDDAIVRLGVGKNMVRAIRHWGISTRVLEEIPQTRGRKIQPTALGRYLFGPRGVDRFLEDAGTLWLLHWELSSRPDAATTWHWVFSHAPQLEFTRADLLGWLTSLVEQRGWTRVGAVSLRRDIDTFLRTYVPSRSGRGGGVEDSIDCPLIELGVLRETAGDTPGYALVRANHTSLPDLIFAYALVAQLSTEQTGARTVPLHAVAFAPGSPGRVFCLSEDALLARLDRISELTSGAVTFDDTAGMRQLLVRELPRPQDLLAAYYTKAMPT